MAKPFSFDEIVKCGKIDEATERSYMKNCYVHFSKSEIRGLSQVHFKELLSSLFVDSSTGKSYYIPQPYQQFFFNTFDYDEDGYINYADFTQMWDKWLHIILWPRSALIIVDVQNDFIGGSLAIKRCPAGQCGEDIIPKINFLLENLSFDLVVYTMDWHPLDHISFLENAKLRPIVERNGKPVNAAKDSLDNLDALEVVVFEGPPKTTQQLWPAHCVQNTPGAELHKDLKRLEKAFYVYKGVHSTIDSYSAFWDNLRLSETILNNKLKAEQISDVYICGIAYDVCVAATALDAIDNGYRTILVEDACRGVNNKEISRCKSNLINKNSVIANSDEVEDMTKGVDRRLELAYALALKLT